MAQKGLWNLGALPKEEFDVLREYRATHDENFMCSRLKEVGQAKKERWRLTDRLHKR